MNPKNFTNPAELMKSWTLANLLEYKAVICECIDDIKNELKTNLDIKKSNELKMKLSRYKNKLIVVNNELLSR